MVLRPRRRSVEPQRNCQRHPTGIGVTENEGKGAIRPISHPAPPIYSQKGTIMRFRNEDPTLNWLVICAVLLIVLVVALVGGNS